MHQVQILTPDADQPGPNTDPRCIVAKGERGHPTRTRTRVYRVPNMRSNRHTKEPGSMAWQPESIFIRSDDHIVTLPSPSGSATMRFTHTGISHAYTNHASPIQCTPPTSASHGVNIPGGPSHNVHGCASDDLTVGHPTSDTICSEGRAWSPHPDSNPGLQGAKHALIFNRRDDHIVTVCVCIVWCGVCIVGCVCVCVWCGVCVCVCVWC